MTSKEKDLSQFYYQSDSSSEEEGYRYKKGANDKEGDAVATGQNREAKTSRMVSKFSNRIREDVIEPSHSTMKTIKESEALEITGKSRTKDKMDRATVEQVLDPRTRLILVKLMNNKVFQEINGCLSTGKEANVYHAFAPNEDYELAVKIYKTSIMVFKDRERYIAGEFRFRHGHCKGNPRKMIKLWAEKELRNLKRIQSAGLLCPEPVLVKANVLVMRFIGREMKAAPRLKDTDLTVERYSQLYLDLVKAIRILYQDCRLIHGDLSEYNLLYWEEKLYLIDVSQSVEHDHPYALEFLRRDCANVNIYFKKQGVRTFSLKSFFDFVTDIVNVTKENVNERLDALIAEAESNTAQEDDDVFAQIYIPRKLDDIPLDRMEADMKKLNGDLTYAKLTGLPENATAEEKKEEGEQSSDEEIHEEELSDNDSEESDPESSDDEDHEPAKEGGDAKGEEPEKKVGGLSKYDGMTKAERKAKVKEEKREKRANKIPKKKKRQLIKKTKGSNK
eukprot:TRINITY_DN1435_c0_g1_i1.p1 TRINITY_DN1435_c0_g1~~TRINITY_DN1435_c0_g1_i1.p1  ORF type:complete len:505 (-),score=169.97 TRINITY_DN1435_c0_g1_i1:96-1610(-)